MICEYCGDQLNIKNNTCECCGAAFTRNSAEQTKTTGNWPVALFKDSSYGEINYFAYDVATGAESDDCETIDQTLKEIEANINEDIDSADGVPTENDIKNDKYVKKLIKKCELEIRYLNINFN